MSNNLDKAYQFLGRIFNGADARLPTFAAELEGMLDQAEEEGKVAYIAEQEAKALPPVEAGDDHEPGYEDLAAAATPEPEPVRETTFPLVQNKIPARRTTGRVVASGKPHPKKKR